MRAMLVCRRRPVSADEPGKTMNELLVPVTILNVEFSLLFLLTEEYLGGSYVFLLLFHNDLTCQTQEMYKLL